MRSVKNILLGVTVIGSLQGCNEEPEDTVPIIQHVKKETPSKKHVQKPVAPPASRLPTIASLIPFKKVEQVPIVDKKSVGWKVNDPRIGQIPLAPVVQPHEIGEKKDALKTGLVVKSEQEAAVDDASSEDDSDGSAVVKTVEKKPSSTLKTVGTVLLIAIPVIGLIAVVVFHILGWHKAGKQDFFSLQHSPWMTKVAHQFMKLYNQIAAFCMKLYGQLYGKVAEKMGWEKPAPAAPKVAPAAPKVAPAAPKVAPELVIEAPKVAPAAPKVAA